MSDGWPKVELLYLKETRPHLVVIRSNDTYGYRSELVSFFGRVVLWVSFSLVVNLAKGPIKSKKFPRGLNELFRFF